MATVTGSGSLLRLTATMLTVMAAPASKMASLATLFATHAAVLTTLVTTGAKTAFSIANENVTDLRLL